MAVLIIDDDAELCELVGEYLEGEGFEVESVHDGVSGVELCLQSKPELVILDVMLPGLGGFAVLGKIREASKVPVIMLTARGEEVDRIVGLEMGADDYIPKPFSARGRRPRDGSRGSRGALGRRRNRADRRRVRRPRDPGPLRWHGGQSRRPLTPSAGAAGLGVRPQPRCPPFQPSTQARTVSKWRRAHQNSTRSWLSLRQAEHGFAVSYELRVMSFEFPPNPPEYRRQETGDLNSRFSILKSHPKSKRGGRPGGKSEIRNPKSEIV